MKICTRCGKNKREADYQIRRASPDGLTASCRSCLKDYDRARSNLPHRIKAREEYAKSPHGKQVCATVKKRWIDRNREKRAAHGALWNAIKRGKLKPRPCEQCGALNAHAHHPDYKQPLDVIWLCPLHHKQAHALAKTLNGDAA